MNRDDAFELRLSEWLEDGPFVAPERGVEAAIAHAWAHPRGRIRWPRSGLGRRWAALPAVPRIAWLAAALVGLLLLLGGALLAGSRYVATVGPGCPLGSTPDVAGQPGGARPAVDAIGIGSLAWDRAAGRMVFLARTATGGSPTAGSVWTFDVCTNTWRRELATSDMPDRGPVVHDEDSALTIAIGDLGVWTYDSGRVEWSRRANAPPGWVWDAVYDPASGLVIGHSTESGAVWTYDVDTDAWREVAQRGAVPPPGGTSGFQLFGFDRSIRRAILTTERETWQLDPDTGAWDEAGLGGPAKFFIGGRQIAYDQAGARTLVYGQGTVAAYDALTRDWEVLAGDPADGWVGDGLEDLGTGYAMAFDPLNDRLVVVGGTRWHEPEGWVPSDGVIAFDLVTREWIELLAPSTPAEAAPSASPRTAESPSTVP